MWDVINYLSSCIFFSSLGHDANQSYVKFKAWVTAVIYGNTTSSERCQLSVTPANSPTPIADLPGCVHLITPSKLIQVKNAFALHQWAAECKQNNRYAGSVVEINGSQAQMMMSPLNIGPFRP